MLEKVKHQKLAWRLLFTLSLQIGEYMGNMQVVSAVYNL